MNISFLLQITVILCPTLSSIDAFETPKQHLRHPDLEQQQKQPSHRSLLLDQVRCTGRWVVCTLDSAVVNMQYDGTPDTLAIEGLPQGQQMLIEAAADADSGREIMTNFLQQAQEEALRQSEQQRLETTTQLQRYFDEIKAIELKEIVAWLGALVDETGGNDDRRSLAINSSRELNIIGDLWNLLSDILRGIINLMEATVDLFFTVMFAIVDLMHFAATGILNLFVAFFDFVFSILRQLLSIFGLREDLSDCEVSTLGCSFENLMREAVVTFF